MCSSDLVTVASAERSKLSDKIRATFVIGVNEGVMPQNVKETGLFTDRDKQNLNSAGLKISKSVMWKIAQERFTAYMALTSASERLYVSFPQSDLMGTVKRPSPIVKQILNMMGNDIVINTSEIKPEFYCVTWRAGYSKYIENIKNPTTSINSLKEVLIENEEYRNKIEFAKSINEESPHAITQYYLHQVIHQADAVTTSHMRMWYSPVTHCSVCQLEGPISQEAAHRSLFVQ